MRLDLEEEAWQEYITSTLGQAARWEELEPLDQEYWINVAIADREKAEHVNKPTSDATFESVPF